MHITGPSISCPRDVSLGEASVEDVSKIQQIRLPAPMERGDGGGHRSSTARYARETEFSR